jgi:hypothetical protein
MDIKAYVHFQKTYINIGFGFSSVYQYKMGTRCEHQNLGQFQKTYINIGFLGIDISFNSLLTLQSKRYGYQNLHQFQKTYVLELT